MVFALAVRSGLRVYWTMAPKQLLTVEVGMIFFAAAALTAMNPLAFFTGTTHGVGTLKILFKGPQTIHVTSQGTPDGQGGIDLDQNVFEGGDLPKARHWNLHPTSSTTLAGTLTPDASGPVIGAISGQEMTLSYPLKGGLTAAQTLTLQPGGRVLLNHMTVKKLRLTVATIDERIVKD